MRTMTTTPNTPDLSPADAALYASFIDKAATGGARRRVQERAGNDAGVRLVDAHVSAGLAFAARVLVKNGMTPADAAARVAADLAQATS